MRKTPIIWTIGVLALALFVLFVAVRGRPDPLVLKISDTAFPSCATRTYAVTPTALKVTDRSGILSVVQLHPESSQGLMRAITNANVAALDGLYENPDVDDGFELSFEFNITHTGKVVTVRNRYVPSLYAILEECNKLVPPKSRVNRKQDFVYWNHCFEQWIAECSTNAGLSAEVRAKIIAELQQKLVNIEE